MQSGLLDKMIQKTYNQNWRPLRRLSILLIAVALGVFSVGSTSAQNYLTSTGSPAFGTPEPVQLGFVDASNGNLHLSIPLGSYPQRATKQPEAITLEYDSSIWTPGVVGTTTEWLPTNSPGPNEIAGWYYSYEAGGGLWSQEVAQNCYTDIYWADDGGTAHGFHLNLSYTGGTGCPSTGGAYATDSSGFYMYQPSNGPLLVYAPDGTLVFSDNTPDPQGHLIIAKDSNGNYMSVKSACPDSVYDTLGRVVAQASTTCGPATATMSTSQGTSSYTFTYATINVNTAFGQSGVQETSTHGLPPISAYK